MFYKHRYGMQYCDDLLTIYWFQTKYLFVTIKYNPHQPKNKKEYNRIRLVNVLMTVQTIIVNCVLKAHFCKENTCAFSSDGKGPTNKIPFDLYFVFSFLYMSINERIIYNMKAFLFLPFLLCLCLWKSEFCLQTHACSWTTCAL